MISVQPYIKSFSVSFTPSNEYDVVYYKVYASHADDFHDGDLVISEATLINEGPETSLFHQVDKGGVWGVKVAAVDTFGEDILHYSELVTLTIPTLDPLDQVPPNTPVFSTLPAAEETGIEAGGAVDNVFIKVTWVLTPVPDDFDHYTLSYKKHSDNSWNELNTTTPSYKLTNLVGGLEYDFTISAVDTWGNASPPSSVKTVTAARDLAAPSPPVLNQPLAGFGGVNLTWSNPSANDLKTIDIYRSVSSTSASAVKVASVFGTAYSDVGLTSNTTYYYWLKAVDYSGNESSFSNGGSASTLQIMVGDLDVNARVDFIVKDAIFSFTHVDYPAPASTTLNWSAGAILRGDTSYTLAPGSLPSANNCYIIATLSGSTATLTKASASGASLPELNEGQIIIALTSSAILDTETNNYACYVRQANSMMLEGAIIRNATITTAKIRDLTADKITTGTLSATTSIGINNDQILIGNLGTANGILVRNAANTEDVFKVDSTGTATLKNILIDGNVTVGESKILLDGVNSRMTVANATGTINDVVTVGKLATGKYGISIKGADGLSVLRVDEDGAIIQNLTSGSINANLVSIANLVVGGNVAMGPNAYIAWGNVSDPLGTKPANNATRNVYVGAWSSSYGSYVIGDNVSYLGKTYGCKTAHTASASYPPTNTTYWQLVSETGQGQVKGVSFIRALTQPATPTGGTFASPNATTSGWSDGIPTDNNQPLWMSTRIFTSDGASPQQSVWTTPQKIGTPSTGSKTQFSVDSVNWHDTPATDDVYMRTGTSTDNGVTWTYSGSVKIKGETGNTGSSALAGYLTNESHSVSALYDGTGYSLTSAGGTFKMFLGTTDITTGCTYSITGGADAGTSWTKTQNGLTFSVNETTGVYSLSGAVWTSDTESFTVVATYGGTTTAKVYTISKSKAGGAGQNATAYWLVASAAAIQKNSSQTSLTPSTLTVTGYSATGTASPSAYAGRFKIYENGSATASYTSSADESSKVYTPSATTISSLKVEMYLAGGTTTKLDEQIIPVVVDGAVGTSGTNAIVAVLSNESHTLPADSNGTVSTFAGCTTTMTVYNGATDDSANWSYSVSKTAGITCTEATTSRVQTVTAMTVDTGTVTIVASRSGYASVTKVFTITKAKGGVIGPAGPVITLTVTKQAFSYLDGTLVAGQSDITFTATLQNITDTVNWTTNPSVTLTGTGNTRALSAANFGTNTQVTVTATAGGLSDSVTIVRLAGITPPTAYSQATEPTTRRSGDTWLYTGTILLDTTRGTVVPNTGYTWNGTAWVMTTPRGTYIGSDGIYTGTLVANQINTSGFTAQSANIADAAITNAKIADIIQSTNYTTELSGWKIDKAGMAEFNTVTVRGKVEAKAFIKKLYTASQVLVNTNQYNVNITSATLEPFEYEHVILNNVSYPSACFQINGSCQLHPNYPGYMLLTAYVLDATDRLVASFPIDLPNTPNTQAVASTAGPIYVGSKNGTIWYSTDFSMSTMPIELYIRVIYDYSLGASNTILNTTYNEYQFTTGYSSITSPLRILFCVYQYGGDLSYAGSVDNFVCSTQQIFI